MATSSLSLNLGIDFGTQYTKVCVRDTDRDQSWVVIPGKPDARIEGSLIVSQVGIHSNGHLVAGLTQPEWNQYLAAHPNLLIIDFIKMRLAHLDPGREASNWYSSVLPTVQGINLSIPEALENLCAFFLCQVIKRSKDWIYLHDADLLKGVDVDWSAIVGVPVEYCDSPALVRFQRVLCLAWHLSVRNIEGVSLSELNQYLNEKRSDLNTSEMQCFTLPELAAAVYSYTFSRQARRGTYIFFDIGGGTMEGAAFQFHRNNADEQPQIDFVAGLVEPVGVNALAKQVACGSTNLERQVESLIIKKGPTILSKIALLSEHYKKYFKRLERGDVIANKHKIPIRLIKASLKPEKPDLYVTQILILAQALIHRQVATVIRMCARKLPKQEMQRIVVFLGGGGMLSSYYVDTIDATYDAFNLSSTAMPRYKMQSIPVPDDLSMSGLDGEHFHRFSIAYGLSIPDYDAPEFQLPNQISNVSPLPVGPRWVPETAHDDG